LFALYGLIVTTILALGGFILGAWYGVDLRIPLAAVLALVATTAHPVESRWRQMMKELLRNRTDDDRADLLRDGIDGALIDDYVDRERSDWAWNVTTTLSGIYLMFVPPVLVTASRAKLSWTSAVTGTEISLMLAGLFTFLALTGYRKTRYKCPSCASRPQRLTSVRFHCRRCRIVWHING
jgi:hypothetical protein